jgi:hypothetical protein
MQERVILELPDHQQLDGEYARQPCPELPAGPQKLILTSILAGGSIRQPSN